MFFIFLNWDILDGGKCLKISFLLSYLNYQDRSTVVDYTMAIVKDRVTLIGKPRGSQAMDVWAFVDGFTNPAWAGIATMAFILALGMTLVMSHQWQKRLKLVYPGKIKSVLRILLLS